MNEEVVKECVCAYIDGKWIEVRERMSDGRWSNWYTVNEISEFEDYGNYDNTEFRIKPIYLGKGQRQSQVLS